VPHCNTLQRILLQSAALTSVIEVRDQKAQMFRGNYGFSLLLSLPHALKKNQTHTFKLTILNLDTHMDE